MITKPTGLVPEGAVTENNGSTITFSCQVLSGSDIDTFEASGVTKANALLTVRSNDKYYHFPLTKDDNSSYAPVVEEDEYAVTLRSVINPFDLNGYYRIIKKNKGTTRNYIIKRDIKLSDVLTTGKEFSWKIRLYSNGSFNDGFVPDIKIEWGTISDVIKNTETQNNEEVTKSYLFSGFGHLSIYDDVIDLRTHAFSTDKNDHRLIGSGATLTDDYIADTVFNVMKTEDDNARYWIDSYGYIIPIEKYRFYPYDGEFTGSTVEALNYSEDFDGYGNPKAGYFVISPNNLDNVVLQDGETIEDVFEGETYNVRCNYIDSGWSYFTLYQKPTIKIKDENGAPVLTSEPIDLQYSEINLTVEMTQSQGIGLEYYSYKIYSTGADGERTLDYSSGNIYDRRMNIKYDRLFSDKTYEVVISIVDVAQRVWERTVTYNTVFHTTPANLYVDTQYYHPHNSIIVDWSEVNSISPATDIDEIHYVCADLDSNGDVVINDTGENNAADIPKNSSLLYTKNDFGLPLEFNGSELTVEFYGTAQASGTIFEYGCDNGFAAQVSCTPDYIQITTTKRRYIYPLYGSYTTEDIADILASNTAPAGEQIAPIKWDNDLYWNNSYHWYTYNNIMTKWKITISEQDISLTYPEGRTMYGRKVYYDQLLPKAESSYLNLHGGVIYDSILVENGDDTLLTCNFANTVNGSDINTSFSELRGWRVYKTMGDNTRIYEVANMVFDNAEDAQKASRILEDFIIGDNVKITYYIYPLLEMNGHIVIGNPLVTDPIFLQEGVDKVCGLTSIGDRVYEVNPDEVWRLFINLDDNGYTFNTDKNFYDTLNRYNQETTGNRKYITKSIGGMLGYIDCSIVSEDGITDTYDMLVSWNEFTGKPGLKCLVDIRGLVLPGNFEANPSVEYEDVKGAYATAKFNWRQMADLDVVKIYGRLLPFNPTKGIYFMSSDGYYLNTNEDDTSKYLLYTSNTDTD